MTSNAQSYGITAWDCHHKEDVLLLPWAHGFQGENLMQSEFPSHIGTTGRNFCRVCNTSGAGAKFCALAQAGKIDKVAEFMKVSDGNIDLRRLECLAISMK